jgi:tRNA A-37 threonylcarbamoyl transferase component Bud32
MNWFERHLNWSLFLVSLVAWGVSFVIAIATGSDQIFYASSFVINLAGVLWHLSRKSRNLGYSALLLIAFIPIPIFYGSGFMRMYGVFALFFLNLVVFVWFWMLGNKRVNRQSASQGHLERKTESAWIPVSKHEATKSSTNRLVLMAGRYKVERELRTGGMAQITLATDTRTDSLCVIKTPRYDTHHDTKYNIDKLTLEAAYLRQFNHPNIVKYLDMFTHDNILHLVVEYIDGQDLLTAFAKKQAEQSRVIKWGGQILNALEHIHHFGLVHRDINPGNIMLRKDDSVVLIDFGTVKPATGEGQTVVRKPGFEIPEQVATGHADVRSDIFGVGGVLFYLLTSTAPGFIGNRDVAELLMSKGVSQPTARCIEQALRIKPDERFLSAAAMRKALGI